MRLEVTAALAFWTQTALLSGSSMLLVADAFSLAARRVVPRMMSDGLPNLPNPFAKLGSSEPSSATTFFPSSPVTESSEFEPTPEGLLAQAKVVLAADLGLQNPKLLAENFVWVGASLDKGLGKKDYLAAGKFFDLRSTFPDLDFRPHDFRIDKADPYTVRLTARTVGTMRGELRLRDEALSPNGKSMSCPPEAISMTFDPKTGKIVKLCTGFGLDRLVGNTKGLCGVMAAATVAGDPPSEFEIYPVPTVMSRFLGRPVSQLPDSTTFLAPFPETVMVQLAKGVLSANMAADDPTLLAKQFTYMTPIVGPIPKKQFLEEFAETEFEGWEPEFSHFRVDPYDPNRVWVDIRPLAPGFQGPPQAMSFTFDDDGFCTRITSGAVMDPSLGNGGGLAGTEGLKYAFGEASPAVLTRPLPRVVSRLQKRIVSPITGVGVDDYAPGQPVTDMLKRPAAKPMETDAEEPETLTLSALKKQIPVSLPEKVSTTPPAAKKDSNPFAGFSLPSVSFPVSAAPPKAPKASGPQAASAKRSPPKEEAPMVKQPSKVKGVPPPKKAPTFSIPSFSLQPVASSPKASKASKQPAKAKESLEPKKSPTFSIPSFSLQPTSSSPKASLASKQPSKPKEAPAPRTPTFSIPSFSLQPTSPTTTSFQVEAAAKRQREEKGKEDAENRRQEAEARKAAAEKQQQEAQAAAAKRQAEQQRLKEKQASAAARAREEQEEARRAAAEKEKRLKEKQVAAVARARQEQEEATRAAAKRRQRELEQQRQADAAAQERREREAAVRASAEEQRKQMEDQRKAAAVAAVEARRDAEAQRQRELEKKKQAAAAAAKQRQQDEAARAAEQQKLQKEKAAAAARAAKLQEEKAAAAAQARKEQEARKAAAELKAKEAEARRVQEEARRAEDERKRKAAEETKQAAERKRTQAQKQTAAASAAQTAKAGATINVFGLGGGPARQESSDKVVDTKPRPTFSLFGSAPPQQAGGTKAVRIAEKARPGSTISLFGLGGAGDSKAITPSTPKQQQAKKAAEVAQTAKPGSTIALFGLGGGETKAPETKAQPAKQQRALQAESSAQKAKPGATIPLFGFGGGTTETKPAAKEAPKKPAPTKPAPAPVAPRGVPVLAGWRRNGDSSITGIISGSPNFRSGEKVTTSPITSGSIQAGSVVKTKSGSRYYLS